VPFGEEFVPYLQKITASLSILFLKISGLPFVHDGVFISVLTGTAGETHNFEVAEECSGIRYMTAMAATATLFANIGFISWTRRLILMVIAFIVPIIANGMRAFGIIYIAHTTDMKHAVGVDHILYGWVFFGLIMALVIFIGYLFMDKPYNAPAVDVGPLLKQDEGIVSKRPFWFGAVCATAVAAVFGVYANVAGNSATKATDQVNISLPEIPGWTTTEIPYAPWNPVYEGATAVNKATYINVQGEVVTLFVAFYDRQTAEREMVRYGNGTTGGDLKWTWAMQHVSPGLKLSPSPSSYQINGGEFVRDVYQWYWVNGKIIASDGGAKLQGALAKLLYGEKRAAVIVLSSERATDAPVTDTLTKFSNDLGSVDAFAHVIADKH
jgi:EpsI family protein